MRSWQQHASISAHRRCRSWLIGGMCFRGLLRPGGTRRIAGQGAPVFQPAFGSEAGPAARRAAAHRALPAPKTEGPANNRPEPVEVQIDRTVRRHFAEINIDPLLRKLGRRGRREQGTGESRSASSEALLDKGACRVVIDAVGTRTSAPALGIAGEDCRCQGCRYSAANSWI